MCLWVIFYWAAGPVGVPGFDFFGIPEGESGSEVCYMLGCTFVGYVGAPGSFADVAVGGAVFDAPELASGVFVGDDGVHPFALALSSVRVSMASAVMAQAEMMPTVVADQWK